MDTGRLPVCSQPAHPSCLGNLIGSKKAPLYRHFEAVVLIPYSWLIGGVHLSHVHNVVLFSFSVFSKVSTSSSTTSITISWTLADGETATSYSISYSNTNNTQCFTDSNDITDISTSETMYTLTDLQEDTEYSITVTAILRDGGTERENLTASTLPSG